MSKTSETILELDLNALEHNYHFLRSKLKGTTKFLAVVKAFAYGSDASQMASKLEQLGVDYLAVAYVGEGVALRKAGIKTPILVLHPQPDNLEELIKAGLEPSLYSPKILAQFLSVAKRCEIEGYPVHLKFNTGLNRLGFGEKEVSYIANQLRGRTEIKVVSVFSHLAASEDTKEKQFTEKQIESFKKIIREVDDVFAHRPLKHLLNTSGILNYSHLQLDMVRSGIGLYGFGNDKEFDSKLKPVATLKTLISQKHKIAPNETVGYNRAFQSEGPRVTATLPLGHADGIGRQYGKGKTFVNVKGKMAPIIGNVCMDMIMIDVTGIDCEEGDEVILFGKNPTAEAFAATADTISYELISGISQRVKRVIRGG